MEYSWITGSVAWYTNTMENYLIGARPTYEGLVIEPHLPFESASMVREFRGAKYEIEIKNPQKKAKDYTVEVTLDGVALESNLVPAQKGGCHKVTVVIK
jgi:cellobiose phosphorylase